MQKPDILEILEYAEPFQNCIPKYIQNTFIFMKIDKYSELLYIKNTTHI